MNTKAESISNIRNLIKGAKTEAFLPDKLIYSLVLSVAKVFVKRKDDSMKLAKYNSLFQVYPGIELTEVSRIEAGCIDIDIACTFSRTLDVLPPIHEGSFGYMIRSVTSIDGSFDVKQTDPKTYGQMLRSSTFKYNKNIYFWVRNGYLYFPKVEWPLIDVEAMWVNDISEFLCSENCCVDRLSEKTNIPDDIIPEVENMVVQKLMGMAQVPQDNNIDNKNILR
jgi:hypothetical protein